MLPLLFKATWLWLCEGLGDLAAAVVGGLSPGLGIPLEGEEPLSFFADVGFPPLGMRLAILDDFLVGSAKESRSSLEVSLSLDFPDLLFSSLSLDVGLLPLVDAFEYEEEEEGALFGAAREEPEPFVGTCLAEALLLMLPHTDPVGIEPSSPHSDRSSSSCRAISVTEGDAREDDRVLIRRNLSSIDLCGPPPPSPPFDPSPLCCRKHSGVGLD